MHTSSLSGYVDVQVPIYLRGDPGRFRQVLLNLIGNAIKFTPSGEVTVRIALMKEYSDSIIIKVMVKDTGVGIDPIAQEHLFQSFQQADSSTTRQFGGTGLGLAICKKLVEIMDGTISVDSQIGQGSTFWFTARLLKQTHPPHIVADKELQGLRICCIDDHPVNLQLLEEYTKSWNMQTVSASTPLEGLRLLEQAQECGEPFELALVDMEMPGIDGATLARTIKANPQLAATRLILLTSIGQRGDAQEAKKAGFSGYLTKPIRQNTLKHTLQTVMGLEIDTLNHPDTPVITRFASLESTKMSWPADSGGR